MVFSHHSAEYLPPILSSQLRVNCTSLYARPRQHYVLFTCCDQREAEGLARTEAQARAHAQTQAEIAGDRAEELRRQDYVSRVNLAYRE